MNFINVFQCVTRLRSRQAMTLVEIMLVVIIIAAISAMIFPRFSGVSDKARFKIAAADITHIGTALKMYEMDNGFYPSTSQGLSALITKPTNGPTPRQWDGPYLEKSPLDPWGNTYEYHSPGKKRPDFDLYSNGKDIDSSEDDITNW